MPSLYDRDIRTLKGIGEARAALYRRLGAATVGDLLRLYPRDYEDWSRCISVADTQIGETCTVKATVLHTPKEQRIRGGMTLYKTTATDGNSDLWLTFFNNKYVMQQLKEGETYVFRGKVGGSMLQREMASPSFLPVGRVLPILPVYPMTKGLSGNMIILAMKNALGLLPQTMKESLPAQLLQEYKLSNLNFALQNIHFPKSEADLAAARNRLIFEEFLVLQLGLMRIKSGRKTQNRHPVPRKYPKDFTDLLPFQLTGAQQRAIEEAICDMAGESPMNRLVQGDVGSGKTAVGAALCWTVIAQGLQAAFMAPTEILASQHYKSLSALLEPAGIRTALLTGSVSAKQKREIYAALETGEIHLVIGTHALISEQVAFQNLGLVITDEQHRFGVGQRSALAQKGDFPHLLVMSATPIPRTLALLMYGDLDVSVLDELPPGRQKIETYLIDSAKRRRAFGYIQKHLDQGRQGYIVCPLIDEDESGMSSVKEYCRLVENCFPRATVGMLHGKLKPAEKEKVMQEFSAGELQLLVSTTVVEVGVDVPNAVIMLIENAERYGLSQLHQLRGRIGRGEHKSTCILLSDTQNEETLERLKILCSTTDGFQIADADLRLRGPGDFFGKRQHGLPQLKIADMMSNTEVLMQAQQCARQLLADGSIETPEYRTLLAETKLLFEKAGGGEVLN